MLSGRPPLGDTLMQLFTLLTGGRPMLTINASSKDEAITALCAMGVTDGDLTIRIATGDEVEAWRGWAQRSAAYTA
jgi:hypothetical protein